MTKRTELEVVEPSLPRLKKPHNLNEAKDRLRENRGEIAQLAKGAGSNNVAEAEPLQTSSEKSDVADIGALQTDSVAGAKDCLTTEKNNDVAVVADKKCETYEEQWAKIKAEHAAAKRN